jgi:hypothetical protein
MKHVIALLTLALLMGLSSCVRDTQNVGSGTSGARMALSLEAVADTDLANPHGGDQLNLRVLYLSADLVRKSQLVWDLDGAAPDLAPVEFSTDVYEQQITLGSVTEVTDFTVSATVTGYSGLSQSDSVNIRVYPDTP